MCCNWTRASLKPGDGVMRAVHVGCVQVLWRYTVLYMTERCYESGGRVWDQVFNNICWCLFICIFFTGSFASSPSCLTKTAADLQRHC